MPHSACKCRRCRRVLRQRSIRKVAASPICDQRRPTFNFALNVDRFALLLDVCTAKERAMNRLIGCLIGGAVHQPFEGNATTAHIISTDLSQIYAAASWAGTVELAIVAAVGLGLWLGERKFAERGWSPRSGSRFRESSKPGAVTGLMAEGDR